MKIKLFNRSFGIYKLMSLPALIVSISMFMIILLNFYQLKGQLQTTAVSQLNRFAVISEKNIDSSISVTNSLYSNPTLSALLTDTELWAENRENGAAELLALQTNYDLIDSVFIYDQKNNSIICGDGIYPGEEFFTNFYAYYNYSASYFNNYIFYDSSAYTVLSPSYVKKGNDKKQIIPIIFRKSYNLNFKQKTMLVLNIDLNKLFSTDTLPEITDNSSVFMLNKYTNDLFCPIADSKYIPQLTPEFLHELLIGTSNIFEHKIDGKATTVATYSVTDSLSGYTYFAVIPHSDIIKSMLPAQLIVGIIALLFLLTSIFLIIIGSRKISNPLTEIISSLENDGETTIDQQKDILDILKSSVSRISDENRILQLTLPCAQEKFLISFLNSTENYMDKETCDKIIDSLPFKYDYFSVIIIRMCPTLKFADTYNSQEYSNIQIGVFDIIKEMFSTEYNSFIIPGKSDELYIILNLDDNESNDTNIKEILSKICSLMEFDHEYITLAVGKSKIYKELSGLKSAHKEALASVNTVAFSDISNANSISLNESEINFNFSPDEERQLLRILTTETASSAKPLLESVFKANIGINARSMRQMYSQILNIILKAMRIKSIPPEDPEKPDFEFSYDILSLPLPDIYDRILSLLDYMTESDRSSSSRTSVSQKVIEYIEQNYSNSSLSLEFLADYFNYTSANISAMIKSTLDIGFHQYLTELRIDKAKKLLTETQKPISQIYKECGFNSQQTFYRTFKKITGLTSGEYRNQSRSQ